MKYQTLRFVSDNHVFVVCRDGTFYKTVPDDVRRQGPWQGNRRGDVDALGARVPNGVRARRLRSGEVRARGVQTGDVLRLVNSRRLIEERQHSAVSFRVMRTCKR